MNALLLLDGEVNGRVLVFGSLPPLGRDIDLLARPREERQLAVAMREAGFVNKGRLWARFRECVAEVVELIPAADWRLPESELTALLDEALPLDGAVNLVRPAPHHALLVAARKLAAGDMVLDSTRRARIRDALARDPAAWQEAERRAAGWEAAHALASIRAAYERGGASRLGTARAKAAAARSPHRVARRLARTRSGALITFSGLDGAGKSSQSRYLGEALEALGHETVVVWTSLSDGSRPLSALRWMVAAVIHLAARRRSAAARSSGDEAHAGDPARTLRRENAGVAFAWSLLMAMSNAIRHATATRGHMLRGRVVICDRWSLDSAVHLRYEYGESRSYRLHEALIRALSPKAARSYFLDVGPEVASARKHDYEVAQNARRAALYRDHHRRFGAIRLDGERPAEELCAEIAADAWGALV